MTGINFNNLNKTEGYHKLETLHKEQGAPSLKKLLTEERIHSASLPAGGGLTYNYAAKPVNQEILEELYRLAEETQVGKKYRALLRGERINTGENRMVLHHLTRGQHEESVIEGEQNLGEFYSGQETRIKGFVDKVHRGEITGSTGKPFTTVVQIGIGGSDLGPRALYLALKGWADHQGSSKMNAQFLSNVDPDDAAEILQELDYESTLFILVSKSGTTQETLTNQRLVLHKMAAAGIPGLDPSKHMVAVTSQTSPLAKSKEFLDSFYIDDYIGGRYSSTSAVGGVLLSLALGSDTFREFLAGAYEADLMALKEPWENAALTDALIGVYERNILGYPMTAILPYSQALSRFPAHLQQLDMESNGKRVNRFNEELDYETGPVIFGEPGTNGQHSFYQLLHQGTSIIPLQFIGFRECQRREDLSQDGVTSQTKLNANLAAQIIAFSLGQDNPNNNKYFPGERPVSLLYGDRLNPRSLGALLAHYENKVMFQGFLWNVNSFDQEGVQLGKVLTNQVLGGDMSPPLKAFAEILGV